MLGRAPLVVRAAFLAVIFLRVVFFEALFFLRDLGATRLAMGLPSGVSRGYPSACEYLMPRDRSSAAASPSAAKIFGVSAPRSRARHSAACSRRASARNGRSPSR